MTESAKSACCLNALIGGAAYKIKSFKFKYLQRCFFRGIMIYHKQNTCHGEIE